MKKKSFGLVLLISVLIIVIGFYILVQSIASSEEPSESENGQIVYIDLQENDVERVTYNDGSSTFTIKRAGNLYVLDEDEDFPVNSTVSGFIFNSVARIVFERKMKVDNSKLGEYGLDNARRVLNVVYRNGAKLTLNIGEQNPYSGTYYCSVGDGYVYLVDSEFADAFEYTYTDLLQDDTVETPQYGFDSLTSIEIKGPSGTVVLSPTEDGSDWTRRVVGGRTDGGYFIDAQQIYSELFRVQVNEWVEYNAYDDAVRDKYGLKGPEIRVIFNHVETVEISTEGSSTVTKEYARTTTFLIGKTLPSDDEDESAMRYFMFGDGSVVYVVEEEGFSSVIDILK